MDAEEQRPCTIDRPDQVSSLLRQSTSAGFANPAQASKWLADKKPAHYSSFATHSMGTRGTYMYLSRSCNLQSVIKLFEEVFPEIRQGLTLYIPGQPIVGRNKIGVRQKIGYQEYIRCILVINHISYTSVPLFKDLLIQSRHLDSEVLKNKQHGAFWSKSSIEWIKGCLSIRSSTYLSSSKHEGLFVT